MANIIGRRIAMPQIAAPQAAQAQLLQVPADAPPAVGSLGGLFQGLAGPFMDTASRDYKNAETARALLQGTQLRQGIQGKQSLADFVKGGGDIASNPALASAILGDVSAANLAGYRRSQVYDDQGNPVGGDIATRASLAAGEPYASTVAGTNQAEANRLLINDLITKRQQAAQERAAQIQAESQVRIAGMTPETVTGADNMPVLTTRGEVTAHPGMYRPQLTGDQLKAAFLMPYLTGDGAGGTGASVAPTLTTAAPAAPGATLDVNAPLAAAIGAPAVPRQRPDLVNAPPDVRKFLDLSNAPSTWISPATGDVAISYNGGQTGRKSDGSYVDLRQGGYTQAGPESGVTEARNALARQQAAAPSPYTSLDATTGRLANAVRSSTGVWPAVGREISGTVGSLTGGALPSLFPSATGGSQELTDFVQRAKGVLANSDQKGIRDQAMVGEMLPGTGVFRSPEDEVQKLGKLAHLLALEEQQIASTIKTTTDPQILARAQSKLNEVHNLQGMITEGAKPYAQSGQPAPAAKKPVIAAPPTTTPSIVTPAAAATPPPGPALTPAEALVHARAALAAGKDPAAVAAMLKKFGGNPADLAKPAEPASGGGTF